MFELHGPNVVIDMGSNSLFQSLMVARDFLMHGECKAVLAGGLNAVRVTPTDAEAAFLTVLTTEATARELNLPIACLLTVGGSLPQTAIAYSAGRNYRGAQGTIELSEAIARAREGTRKIVVREQQSDSALARELVFQPAQTVVKPNPSPCCRAGSGDCFRVDHLCLCPEHTHLLLHASRNRWCRFRLCRLRSEHAESCF